MSVENSPTLFMAITVIVILLIVVALVYEYFFSVREGIKLYGLKDTFVNFSMYMLKYAVPITFIPVMENLYESRFFEFDLDYLPNLFLLFLIHDFSYYCFHRAAHSVRLAWANHVVHHSSEEFNFSTAIRFSSFGSPVVSWIYWGPACLLGFPPEAFIIVRGIHDSYTFFIHTRSVPKLPFCIEFIFNTPSHHRVHHAKNNIYIDKNFGGILIIWDRIFRTFAEEKEEEHVVYGVKRPVNSYNPFVVVFHEYYLIAIAVIRSKRISDAIKYLFFKPGWKPPAPNPINR